MKKIVISLFMVLLCCTQVLAGHCGHDVDRSWEYISSKSYASWTFKNTTDKSIVITHIGLKSKSDKIMADVDQQIYLKPFGVAYGKIYVGDLNLDVAGVGFTRCKYGSKPIAKKKKYKFKQKSGAQKLLDKIRGN